MALVELETAKGEHIAVNPFRVVSVRQERLPSPDMELQPVYQCTLTMAGGSKEVVKGTKTEVIRVLDAGSRGR